VEVRLRHAEDAFAAETEKLYNQLKPLYTQLHCYTRAKLNKMYGDKVVSKTGTIPAHLTGNMWAQQWGWLYRSSSRSRPAGDRRHQDARDRRYDEKKMVKISEAFYTSLGFPELPATFWERSMFAQARGRKPCATRARGTSR